MPIDYFKICLIWMFITSSIKGISYNQPKFSPYASWNPNAITFTNSNQIGTNPYNIFINTNNNIYIPNRNNKMILIWNDDNNRIPTRHISIDSSGFNSIFVTENDDIYIAMSTSYFGIEKLPFNSAHSIQIMYSCTECVDIFIDTSDQIYCSMRDKHQVVRKSPDTVSNIITIVAGTSSNGTSDTMLSNPLGIFVDINFDLYVADCGNDRIQLFSINQLNGTTVVGSTSPNTTFPLDCPTGVILDADKYLFIVDQRNHRIVGSGPNGFRCLVGCSGSGNAPNLLNNPTSMAFDTYGNIYVTDTNNNRIQKFVLLNNTNFPSYNTPQLYPSTAWSPNAITVADNSTIGTSPRSIYIDINNTLYVANYQDGAVRILFSNGSNITKSISRGSSQAYIVFSSSNGDIYVSSQSSSSYYIDKFTLNDTNSTLVGESSKLCIGLFVDINDILYCSLDDNHQVIKTPLDDGLDVWTNVAGLPSNPGPGPSELREPCRIFVDDNLDLYVADYGNDRIQLFHLGITTGITVTGSTSPDTTITLNRPTGVILDADKYLFIVDNNNHRIVGSGPNGFRCLVGCSGSGSTANLLKYPTSMAFDNNGNIYVTDTNNNRIQKFVLLNNTNPPSYNTPKLYPSTVWNPNAITFANGTTIGNQPRSIHININNTIYVPNYQNGTVRIWFSNGSNITKSISRGSSKAYMVFSASNGDIYVSSQSSSSYYIDKFTLNDTNSTLVGVSSNLCYGLFIDINDILYCSMRDSDQVVKKPLDSNSDVWSRITDPTTLTNPSGIFVDDDLDLYVADSGNDRIQLFHLGISIGITVAGSNSTTTTMTLNAPTGVILDADKYLFIVDQGNNRIVGSGSNGFLCIIGCSSNGSLPNLLNNPASMAFDNNGNIYVTDTDNNRIQKFLLLDNTNSPSYNTPTLSASTAWNPNAITFVTSDLIGDKPQGIYIDINNTIYVPNYQNGTVRIWFSNGSNITESIFHSSQYAYSIFVTYNGDIYVGGQSSSSSYYIDKLTLNDSSSISVGTPSKACYGLFVDITDILYCSIRDNHEVVKKTLDSSLSAWRNVAGVSGKSGSGSKNLKTPNAIFVDVNWDLYVADCGNDRIQLFHLGISIGITVAGSKSTTITLNCPTGVILDGDKYLFIVDNNNHRIVGSGPNGFRCLVGCSGSGNAPNLLSSPTSMAFDTYGNIYVTDTNNNRIQKFLLLNNTNPPSYNTPKFCALTTWNQTAITFADSSTIGNEPRGIHIDINNTIYVANYQNGTVRISFSNGSNITKSISRSSSQAYMVFSSSNGDIYVSSQRSSSYYIDKFTLNDTNSTLVGSPSGTCYGLFVDINDILYCSMRDSDQVVKKPLDDGLDVWTNVAGSAGHPGPGPTKLWNPCRIFVDDNLDLYVADSGNNRIQLFHLGISTGITVAGSWFPYTGIKLNRPTGVILDADKYLFIVDQGNNRIVGSGPNGFRCIVGCSGSSGSTANKLSSPSTMAFDSFGNIFVTDIDNNRVQKFTIFTNSCNATITTGENSSSIYVTDEVETSAADYAETSSIDTDNNITEAFNDISYNLPKLNPYAQWNPEGITFASNTTLGAQPFSLFIDRNNTIYAANTQFNQIVLWKNSSFNVTRIVSANFSRPYVLFIAGNGDIFISNNYSSNSIAQHQLNSNSTTTVMLIDQQCFGLFVDIAYNIYCSLRDLNQVVKKHINSISNTLIIVAGSSCSLPTSNVLNRPYGIFVDGNFDLYVADCGNDRIQLFSINQLNGTTVAGSNSTNTTFPLDCPTGVILDADKYLFIVDQSNHRIIGSGPNGFRCIVGCSGSSGSTAEKLLNPTTMVFDSFGNIYVTDTNNNRIQKFVLLNNTNLPSYNIPKFCALTTWNQTAITFAESNPLGNQPQGIYIDIHNTIYVASYDYGKIYIWFNNGSNITKSISRGSSQAYSIFVTYNGNIYVGSQSSSSYYVDKFTVNDINSTLVGESSKLCIGLFVDINDILYCSMRDSDQVVKKPLDSNSDVWSRITDPTSLNSPSGIFVDVNLDLYVADSGNDRIQLFHLGISTGITVAGSMSPNTTITLNGPTGVILDVGKYLFIVDQGNNRIVGSGPNGFRCLVGCVDSSGSTADKLSSPSTMAFDSFGNIYVTDKNNNRVQKFMLPTNSCIPIPTKQKTFIPNSCPNQDKMGTNCNVSSDLCSLLDPCKNNGTCINTTRHSVGYECVCQQGFDGVLCENDRRPCKPNTCWNNGSCSEVSSTEFKCSCQIGWTGDHCELMINYCEQVTCENNGVCRPLFMNYTCECLGESFSGRHCEIVSTKTIVLKTVSKSFAYIAIICLVIVIGFFIIMDILKYCFGIDPTKDELERIRREKARKRMKRRPVIQKFTYVNAPSPEKMNLASA